MCIIIIVNWYKHYRNQGGHRISYSVATLSYDNYYTNLRDYGNFLVSDLL